MTITKLLDDCRRFNVKLSLAVDYEGPEGAFANGLADRLRDRKPELIRVLSCQEGHSIGLPIADWRYEWLQEVGVLSVRCSHSRKEQVKNLLLDLMKITPRNLDEWIQLSHKIRDTEYELRTAGDLPSLPNFQD